MLQYVNLRTGTVEFITESGLRTVYDFVGRYVSRGLATFNSLASPPYETNDNAVDRASKTRRSRTGLRRR